MPRRQQPGRSRTWNDHLHPTLHKTMAVLLVWMIAAAWQFWAGQDMYFVPVVITGLALMAVGLPFVLWKFRTGAGDWPRRYNPEHEKRLPFSRWVDGDFVAERHRLKGTSAAVMILLPLAAAPIGLTLLLIVWSVV